MALICYRERTFRPDSLARIETANGIVDDYLGQGLRLTLRQLYYQFVAHHGLPNTERSYKGLAALVSDARLAGLIDWDAIEDRGRQPDVPSDWSGIPSLVESALRAYRLPRWDGQDNYVELWVEKQALAGVLEPLAREFHVTLMVNKGYSSQSAMHEAAKRFIENGQGAEREPVLLYLGDHDPSGEDMVRDIGDRLAMFGVEDLDVRKLALTMEQIEQYHPPPNPTKVTDSRAAGYIAKHGASSWEVDALDPSQLAQLIRDEFVDLVDMRLLSRVRQREEADKAKLKQMVAKGWRDDG